MPDRIQLQKSAFIIFNIIYAIFGIIGLGTGIHFAVKYTELTSRLDQHYDFAKELILDLDCTIDADDELNIGLLVISSAWILLVPIYVYIINSKTMFKAEWVGLPVLALALGKIFYGVVIMSDIGYPTEMKSYMQALFKNYTTCDMCHAIQTFLEKEHKCCGIDGPIDYRQFDVVEYPNSCYLKTSNSEKLQRNGCEAILRHHFYSRRIQLVVILFISGILEILGIIGLGIGINFAMYHSELVERLAQDYDSAEVLILDLDCTIDGDDDFNRSLLVVSSEWILLAAVDVYIVYTKNTQILGMVGFPILAFAFIKIAYGAGNMISTGYPTETRSYMENLLKNYTTCDVCHAIQTFLEHQCCGVDGPTDYRQLGLLAYPESCYLKTSNVEKLKRNGCEATLRDHFYSKRTELGLLNTVSGVLEILGYFNMMYLLKAMKIPENISTAQFDLQITLPV